MRTWRITSTVVLLLISFFVGAAQSRRFTKDNIEYVLDLPSPAWQVVSRVDVHEHPEFSYGGNAANGHLRLRKTFVAEPVTASELFQREQKWELQYLPGYVVCSECDGVEFKGRLDGVVYAYEYVAVGKTMYGRVYYLQVDQHTFYSLRFTVARDQLRVIREQMDLIAQSFHLK